MVTKKSSKSTRTKTNRQAKTACATGQSFRKTVCDAILIALAILFVSCAVTIVTVIVVSSKTKEDSQKIKAFDSLAESYIYHEFLVEGEQAATVTGTGVTEDGDLYTDFVITKYENHIPVLERPGRLHFQCDQEPQENLIQRGCAQAYWYGDWKEIKAE